jgi:hypothetical protein
MPYGTKNVSDCVNTPYHPMYGLFILRVNRPYTLAGFELTTHSSSLLGGRRRRYHQTTPKSIHKLINVPLLSEFKKYSRKIS